MYRKDHKDEYYTRRAHKEGYPARSVYKLKEIDEKFRIISKSDKVLDLGSVPGSWFLYLSQKVGKEGRVVGIDSEDIKIQISPNATFIKKDVLTLTPEDIQALGGPFDAVVADLAPSTTGTTWMDVGKSLELNEMAFDMAKNVLKTGGNFVTKIFDGEDVIEFIKAVEGCFQRVKRYRPMAVVKRSREFYLVAMGYDAKRD